MVSFSDNAVSGRRFAVAPMIDWTDRHCRFFHRCLTRHTLLYTEMVTAAAIRHGDARRLLEFDADEHPVALQLGGSEPDELARAARVGAGFGYDEINLNVGCPSDRVQSGSFGACLMAEPARVGACVAAMKEAVAVPVTVKCRLGIDDQDTEATLDSFAQTVWDAGADALIVHARKAWLQGLSPKENREIPPLDHARVHRLKADNPDRIIVLNGGLQSLDEAASHLAHVDGVMLGRAAYRNPALLLEADARILGAAPRGLSKHEAVESMIAYIERELKRGTPLHHLTRPMLGLFMGEPGARSWRRILTVEAQRSGAGVEVIERALAGIGSRESVDA